MPTGLARWIADVLGYAYESSGLSNRALEKKTKEAGQARSDSYLRDRIVDKKMPLTISDVEILCTIFGLGDPGRWIADVERELSNLAPNVSGMEDRQILDEALTTREPASGAYELAARRLAQIRSDRAISSEPPG